MVVSSLWLEETHLTWHEIILLHLRPNFSQLPHDLQTFNVLGGIFLLSLMEACRPGATWKEPVMWLWLICFVSLGFVKSHNFIFSCLNPCNRNLGETQLWLLGFSKVSTDCFFPNMILLLIIWKFHIIHPDPIHFPVLLGPPQLLRPPPKHKKKEKQPNKNSSPICIGHIFTRAWPNSQWPAL